MQKWEYSTTKGNTFLVAYELDLMGEQGWELAAHCTTGGSGYNTLHFYTFKRPIVCPPGPPGVPVESGFRVSGA